MHPIKYFFVMLTLMVGVIVGVNVLHDLHSNRDKYQVGDCYAYVSHRAVEHWEDPMGVGGVIEEIRIVKKVLAVGKEQYRVARRYHNDTPFMDNERWGSPTESKFSANRETKVDCDVQVVD